MAPGCLRFEGGVTRSGTPSLVGVGSFSCSHTENTSCSYSLLMQETSLTHIHTHTHTHTHTPLTQHPLGELCQGSTKTGFYWMENSLDTIRLPSSSPSVLIRLWPSGHNAPVPMSVLIRLHQVIIHQCLCQC